jgi:hypothetical protein
MPQCEDPAFGQEGTYATNHNLPVAAGLPPGSSYIVRLFNRIVFKKLERCIRNAESRNQRRE